MKMFSDSPGAAPPPPSADQSAGPRTDPELLALVVRARDGELAAQAELIRRYRRRLSGFVWPMVRDREAVEDVLQSVCLKFVRRLPGLRDAAVFEWWLFTLARNTALDHLRRRRRNVVVWAPDEVLHAFRDPAAEDRSREIRETLERVLRHTSPSKRRILEKVIVGASYEQIARAERISLGAVKARLHRLREEIRREAGPALGDLWSARRASDCAPA